MYYNTDSNAYSNRAQDHQVPVECCTTGPERETCIILVLIVLYKLCQELPGYCLQANRCTTVSTPNKVGRAFTKYYLYNSYHSISHTRRLYDRVNMLVQHILVELYS